MVSWQDWHDDYQTFIWHFQFTSRLYLHWACISTISNFIFRVGLFMPQHITSDQNRIIHQVIRRGSEINSHSQFKALWPTFITLWNVKSQHVCGHAGISFSGFNLHRAQLVVTSLAVRGMGTISAGMSRYQHNHWPIGWALIGLCILMLASDWSGWASHDLSDVDITHEVCMWGLNYTNIQASETWDLRHGDQRPGMTIQSSPRVISLSLRYSQVS